MAMTPAQKKAAKRASQQKYMARKKAGLVGTKPSTRSSGGGGASKPYVLLDRGTAVRMRNALNRELQDGAAGASSPSPSRSSGGKKVLTPAQKLGKKIAQQKYMARKKAMGLKPGQRIPANLRLTK